MTETSPTRAEIAAWARLVRVSQRLLGAVEADMKRAGLPPLAWYDALLELRRAGEAGLRPHALQGAMLLEQYNLSRLLDRLEKAGLIRRSPCPDDRRGQILHLAEAGAETLSRMWPVYRRAIAMHFAGPLERGEAEVLLGLLARFSPEAQEAASGVSDGSRARRDRDPAGRTPDRISNGLRDDRVGGGAEIADRLAGCRAGGEGRGQALRPGGSTSR